MDPKQTEEQWSRRFFLQSSFVGLALLGSRLLFPEVASGSSLQEEGRIRLYNVGRDERLTVRYRSRSGRYDREALKDINYLLRCNHTKNVHRMDIRLLEFLNTIEKTAARGKEVHISSGYRSPAFNFKMVLHEQGAALNSFHTKGKAMDFSIPGVKLSSIHQAAVKIKMGGVGNYRSRGFIHIDTGRPRFW
ncbi:MAG: DUF882 domain-containing protein [Nitrospirota bacterium]|nr:DUF882 domain-containing protein [Nitrospirota bacterium]MDH5587871.1 DUF882 domain-containing protein [Nitrospirota bacterium]